MIACFTEQDRSMANSDFGTNSNMVWVHEVKKQHIDIRLTF